MLIRFLMACLVLLSLALSAAAQMAEQNFMNGAWSGQTLAVRSLLESGRVDADMHYQDGTTALMVSSLAGHENVVSLLLEHGADVNRSNEAGETALILAATYGFTGVATQLIEAGADVNARDKSGRTAWTWASWGENARLTAILDKSGSEKSGKTDPFDDAPPLSRFEKTPEFKKFKGPEMPKDLHKSGVSGDVVINLIIGRDGKAHGVEIEKSVHEELDAVVMKESTKWRFEPGEVQGKPVEGAAKILVTYVRGQDRRGQPMLQTARWRN